MAPLSSIVASAGAASLAARGFSYHDNAVMFYGPNWITGGAFTVRDMSISAGQDPQSLNHVGDVHTMTNDANGNPTLTFTAGRHKTSDVANWWNQRVAANQNSFGHTAGQLNFAFIGDLTINMAHPQSAMPTQFTVPSAGLAQGSDDNGSNWWFGGSTCAYAGFDGGLSCNVTDTAGRPYKMNFQRGQNTAINEIAVLDYTYLWSTPTGGE